MGGKPKAYSRVQGGWVGQKRGDSERTYFMGNPMVYFVLCCIICISI